MSPPLALLGKSEFDAYIVMGKFGCVRFSAYVADGLAGDGYLPMNEMNALQIGILPVADRLRFGASSPATNFLLYSEASSVTPPHRESRR